MPQPLPPGVPTVTAPSFYLTARQPLRPGAILLATVAAVGALSSVLLALGHTGPLHLTSAAPGAGRSASGPSQADEDKDDPSQIDTIVLGDPTDAPVPSRRGDHVSPVHPTIIVHLPRYGNQVGLIPDTPAGRLLYGWLAAFNKASYPALGNALPTVSGDSTAAAQIELRQQTGGFSLLSAREVQPGVLVFRLRDQTPSAVEVLGTLQLLPNSSPAAIASFSLRAVPPSTQPRPRRLRLMMIPHRDKLTPATQEPMTPNRTLALDVGKVRIGVALSDPLGYTAQPLLTLYRKSRGEDLRNLTRLTRKHEITEIVVGNPLHLSGDLSPWAARVQQFAAELGHRTNLPIHLWDERLTSVAAHEILDEAGHERRGRKHIIDQVAAVVILRDWMEHQAHLKARGELATTLRPLPPSNLR